MKRIYLLASLCSIATASFSQVTPQNDTIRIGSILIIKKGDSTGHAKTTVSNGGHYYGKKGNSRVSTNTGFIDLGFSNWDDQTDYGAAGNYLVSRPGYPALSKADFKLRGGKSINVNIWLFMQKQALDKGRHINLKYGLGLELNNYRFRSPVSFKEDGAIPYGTGIQTNEPFVFRDSISFSKNKLAADYLTVPLMFNLATNHPGKSGLSVSFGVSGGYLYSQRNKQVSNERGKEKNKGDYDLERFKFSYVGDLGLGPVRLYGSYSPGSIFERGLNLRPFTIGLRLSNW